MNKIERTLRDALTRAGATDAKARQALYERARATLENSSAATSPNGNAIQGEFEAAIAAIERSFPEDASAPAAVSDETGNDETAPDAPSAESAPPKAASKRWRIPEAVMAVVLVAAVAGVAWFWLSRPSAARLDSFGGGLAANEVGTPLSAFHDGRFEIVESGNGSVLRVTGPAAIFAKNATEIDTSKTYAMKIRVRVGKDDAGVGGARILAGVATFDAQGKLQTTAPGSHRYFAAIATLKQADGWREFEGTITGEGNQTHKTFRPGTATAKPVVLVNFQSPQAVTDVAYIHFKECDDADNCDFAKE